MITLEQAASRARSFLGTVAGVPLLFTDLEDIVKEEDMWVVSYRYTPFLGSYVIYVVKVSGEDGQILEYSKSQAT